MDPQDRTHNRTSPEREPLDTARIVGAAIDLADSEGVGSLTMRRLADLLGFKVMALYNHVTNKDELIALMLESVAARIERPPTDSEPLDAVRFHAIATRAAFVRHRWAPELWNQHRPGPDRLDLMEQLLAALNTSGLPEEIAHLGFHAVNNHVLGYSLQELAMDLDPRGPDGRVAIEEFLSTTSIDTHPNTVAHVRQHLDGRTGSSFELVLDLILDGLVQLGARDGDPVVYNGE